MVYSIILYLHTSSYLYIFIDVQIVMYWWDGMLLNFIWSWPENLKNCFCEHKLNVPIYSAEYGPPKPPPSGIFWKPHMFIPWIPGSNWRSKHFSSRTMKKYGVGGFGTGSTLYSSMNWQLRSMQVNDSYWHWVVWCITDECWSLCSSIDS